MSARNFLNARIRMDFSRYVLITGISMGIPKENVWQELHLPEDCVIEKRFANDVHSEDIGQRAILVCDSKETAIDLVECSNGMDYGICTITAKVASSVLAELVFLESSIRYCNCRFLLHSSILIFHYPDPCQESQILELFSPFGSILSVIIHKHNSVGLSAEVKFTCFSAAFAAELAYDGVMCDGHQLVVCCKGRRLYQEIKDLKRYLRMHEPSVER